MEKWSELRPGDIYFHKTLNVIRLVITKPKILNDEYGDLDSVVRCLKWDVLESYNRYTVFKKDGVRLNDDKNGLIRKNLWTIIKL